MNITRKDIDKLNAELTISIEKSDYEEKVNDTLKDYRKKAQLKGFRPGKTPMGIINKTYRIPVIVDQVNKIISESITAYLKENSVDILGDPLPSETVKPEIDWENDEKFEFVFDFAIAPEYDITISKKDKALRYNIKVDDKQIDEAIENYASRLGEYKSADKSKDDDVLNGKLVQLDQSGNILDGGIFVEEATLSIKVIKDDAEKKKFVGVKANDEITFDIKKAYPNDTELASLLKVEKDVIETLQPQFKFTVVEIKRFENAEVNQDLWDKIYGKDKVKTVEEFRTKIKEEIEQNLTYESDYKLSADVKELMIKKFKANLPEEFLKRWLKRTNEKVDDEKIEKEFPLFIEDLKWQLIKNRIAKENEMKIEEKDIIEKAKQIARVQYMYYGISDIPEDHLESYAIKMLEREGEAERMAQRKLDDMVMEYLKNNIKVEEKEISREKFLKLSEK